VTNSRPKRSIRKDVGAPEVTVRGFQLFGLRHRSAPLKIPQRGCCAFSRNGGRGFATTSCRAQKSAWKPACVAFTLLWLNNVPIFEVCPSAGAGGACKRFGYGIPGSLWRHQFGAGDGGHSSSCSSMTSKVSTLS